MIERSQVKALLLIGGLIGAGTAYEKLVNWLEDRRRARDGDDYVQVRVRTQDGSPSKSADFSDVIKLAVETREPLYRMSSKEIQRELNARKFRES